MKTIIIIVLCSIFCLASFAQSIPTDSMQTAGNDCNCENGLKQLIQKIESEYPGFNEKTKDKIIYDNFKESLLKKAVNIKEPDCIGLLRDYKEFFRDAHISIYSVEDEQSVKQKNTKDNIVAITQQEFQQRIGSSSDPMEGIWRSGAYKVGIVKINNEYQGFIIEADTLYWKANEIKFRLFENGKAQYFLRDHSISDETYELVDGWILYFNYSKFIREYPKPNLSESEVKSRKEEIEGCYFKMVTEKTALLCLSSFEHNYVEGIKKLLTDNIDAIETSENLIIDIRNNLGGTYDAYGGLFPYIITNDIRDPGMEFLVTQTLIEGIRDWYDDEDGKKKAEEWIKKFRGKIGEFVNTDTANIYINEITPAERSPKQVVILVNHRTASAGEAFVFDCKQSKKVKVLGTPTFGALDYGSASFFEFGCKNYKLMMPTWRSMRLPDYPIDNIGIQPDIYLDNSIKDWIQYAVNYLENKKLH